MTFFSANNITAGYGGDHVVKNVLLRSAVSCPTRVTACWKPNLRNPFQSDKLPNSAAISPSTAVSALIFLYRMWF